MTSFDDARKKAHAECKRGEITRKEYEKRLRAIDRAEDKALEHEARAAIGKLAAYREQKERERVRTKMRQQMKQSLRRYQEPSNVCQ